MSATTDKSKAARDLKKSIGAAVTNGAHGFDEEASFSDAPRESLMQDIPENWLSDPPPPQEWVWEDRIPLGCVTAVLAEGGMSKSMFALTLATRAVGGAKRFFTPSHDPRYLMQGSVAYVIAEDPPDQVRRRLFSLVARRINEMVRGGVKGEELKEQTALVRRRLREHLKFFFVVGKDIHLIDTTTGEVVQGQGVDWLIEDMHQIDNLKLVILDPLARLHGGEENSNAVSTALINAAERIAQEFNCAVLLLHHVSKQSAADKNVSAHAGRGGSALGDGARSVLRLLAAVSADVKGLSLIRDGKPIDAKEIADGNVVRIVHAKSSYGRRQGDLFLLKDKDTGELLPLKVVTDERDPYHANVQKLIAWMKSRKGGAVTAALIKSNYRQISPEFTRDPTLALFEDAKARGVLIPDPTYTGKNPTAAGFVLADPIPADTGGIPADMSRQYPDVEEGVSTADTGGYPPSYSPPVYSAGIGNGKKPTGKNGYRRDTGGPATTPPRRARKARKAAP